MRSGNVEVKKPRLSQMKVRSKGGTVTCTRFDVLQCGLPLPSALITDEDSLRLLLQVLLQHWSLLLALAKVVFNSPTVVTFLEGSGRIFRG